MQKVANLAKNIKQQKLWNIADQIDTIEEKMDEFRSKEEIATLERLHRYKVRQYREIKKMKSFSFTEILTNSI